jgi:hypothetical protein
VRDLRLGVEHLLPAGLEVKVASIEKVADYEQPLIVLFKVKGNMGSSTGRRMLLPGELFESNPKPTFTHEKRESAVYFEYPYSTQDAIRVNFPASLAVESLPVSDSFQFQKSAAYALHAEPTPTSVTVRREFTLGNNLYMPDEYPALRTFYGKLETKIRRAWS